MMIPFFLAFWAAVLFVLPASFAWAATANLANGNLRESVTLFSLPQNKFRFGEFKATYNSLQGTKRPLGTGWTHTLNILLLPNNDGSYTLLEGDGRKLVLYKQGDRYTPRQSTYPFLTMNPDQTSVVEKKEGIFYRLDAQGKISSISDRNGYEIAFKYDSGGNLVEITDPSGRKILFTYGPENRIETITDPLGNVHGFSYAEGDLTEVSSEIFNLGKRMWSYAYYPNGFLQSKTDPLSFKTEYFYDDQYRVVKRIDPEGGIRQIVYDPAGPQTQVKENDGGVWIYCYDSSLGVLRERADPLGNTTRYEYDAMGNLAARMDANGNRATFTYDPDGNVTSVTDALGQTTFYTYNDLNQATQIAETGGAYRIFTYDPTGNLTSTTDTVGAVAAFTYDSKGNVISIKNPLGRETRLAYNDRGYLASFTDPSGAVTVFQYDAGGNLSGRTDPLGNVLRLEYNGLNQATRIIDPLGNVSSLAYDLSGNLKNLTDANGNRTSYDSDFAGRVTGILNALGQKIVLTYGPSCPACGGGGEKITSITDLRGNKTWFKYDLAGRLVAETDPLGNSTSYFYDRAGNLTARRDGNGSTVAFAYDPFNRLVRRICPDGTEAEFSFDPRGYLVRAANNNIAYDFVRDLRGALLQVKDSRGNVLGYEYDLAGNRTRMVTPEGRAMEYDYDAAGRPTRIRAGRGEFIFSYDPAGRRIGLDLPNLTYVNYDYDAGGRLTGLRHEREKRKRLAFFEYDYDPAGNRVAQKELDRRISYSYDATYQLIASRVERPRGRHWRPDPSAAETFSYDPAGNRLTGPRAGAPYTYNNANQLLEDGKHRFEYDPNGNLIRKTRLGGTPEETAYSYNFENQLTQVRIQRGKRTRIISFAYDPFGRRIFKAVHVESWSGRERTHETHFVYDDEDLLAEQDAHGKVQSWFVHGPGIDEPLAFTRGSREYYFHADGLGSIAALTDHRGRFVAHYEYSSFGDLLSRPFAPVQPYAFTGREWDEEIGLYYYRARYYDPKAGRFITKDPIGSARGDVNQYRYVGNNATNFADPWGQYRKIVHYYLTYQWAIEEGLDPRIARIIAEANQLVDEVPFQNSLSLAAWSAGGAWFHFPFQGTAELEMMKCVKLQNLEAFGRQLHSLQDSFSHQGIGPITHAIRGNTPDDYDWNNLRDQAMEQATRWWLRELNKSLSKKRY